MYIAICDSTIFSQNTPEFVNINMYIGKFVIHFHHISTPPPLFETGPHSNFELITLLKL